MEAERGRLTVPESRPKRRWYHITPDRLIVGLLAFEVFLLLSEWFQWFAFNEKKGWTVLIAVTAVCLVVVVMVLWLGASLLFRWRFQFSLRSLVLVVAVAVPCSWLTLKLREAERQRRAVAELRRKGAHITYRWVALQWRNGRRKPEPPYPPLLWNTLGEDFFSGLNYVYFSNEATDEDLAQLQNVESVRWVTLQFCWRLTDQGYKYLAGLDDLEELDLTDSSFTDVSMRHLHGLKKLQRLSLYQRGVTDAGLRHLEGMDSLQSIGLRRTNVSTEGVDRLREALPKCEIWRYDDGVPPMPREVLMGVGL